MAQDERRWMELKASPKGKGISYRDFAFIGLRCVEK
jgi:hypothetical protein